VPHLCQVIKSVGSVPRNGQAKAAKMLSSPLLTNVWAAGLSFARCHFERRVPVDPNLPFVFDGEESTRTARGFTWGCKKKGRLIVASLIDSK
jgi:Glycosyltransferase (GlcNAc).